MEQKCVCLCKNTHHPQTMLTKDFTAFFIPPKQEQAFLQGGTFVFDDGKTILAHYDPSTAAHADIDYAVKLATDSVNSSVAAA
mmetsp:Transcript_21221/g.32463  ORF Transcript_21221/g.32463 Transcript_21221/m.32463 type:complete len:83 (+) Transcript_21221:705-953(+)